MNDALYITDAELIRRLGVPEKTARVVIRELEAKNGFPRKQELWGGRRYWPAVKAYLDRMNGVGGTDASKGR
jgi:predicted transcriptional regulator